MIRLCSIVILVAVITIAGCSNSAGPIDPSSSKDPRTYTWSLDTLFYAPSPDDFIQTVMHDVWGLNDTLVYAVGHDAHSQLGAMWKYNGKKWERIHLSKYDGGTVEVTFAISAIKGFAENDIYAFGEIWTNPTGEHISIGAGIHFDGTQWREIPLPPGKGIFSFLAPSPSSMYCGGLYDGQLYHYDGVKWSVDTITTSPFPDLGIMVDVIGVSSAQDVYLQTVQFKNVSGGFLYKQIIKRTGTKSIVLDSAYNDPHWGGRSYWQSNAGNIYSCGTGGIFILSGDKWKPLYSPEVIYSIFGTSDQHMFAVGQSNIYFYDGNKWEIVCPYIGTSAEVRIWCSETAVFISFTDGVKTYILHGNNQ